MDDDDRKQLPVLRVEESDYRLVWFIYDYVHDSNMCRREVGIDPFGTGTMKSPPMEEFHWGREQSESVSMHHPSFAGAQPRC